MHDDTVYFVKEHFLDAVFSSPWRWWERLADWKRDMITALPQDTRLHLLAFIFCELTVLIGNIHTSSIS